MTADLPEDYTGIVCRNCGKPAHVGSCSPKGKTNRQHAEEELNSLRHKLEAPLRADDPALRYARGVALSLTGGEVPIPPKPERVPATTDPILDSIVDQDAYLARGEEDRMGELGSYPGHLKLVVSKNVSTLGDVAEVLRGLQAAGVTGESLMYVIDRVYVEDWQDWRAKPAR